MLFISLYQQCLGDYFIYTSLKNKLHCFFIIAYEECFLGRYFLIVAFMKGSFIKSTFYIESTFYENC